MSEPAVERPGSDRTHSRSDAPSGRSFARTTLRRTRQRTDRESTAGSRLSTTALGNSYIGTLIASFWLAYLLDPLSVIVDKSGASRAVGVAALVTFALIYLAGITAGRRARRLTGLMPVRIGVLTVVGMVACCVAMAPAAGGAHAHRCSVCLRILRDVDAAQAWNRRDTDFDRRRRVRDPYRAWLA
jgi:hypothetical protein